jgi:dipeptidyl aminopeptidase/acylaminoacyl peptidase
MTIYQVGLSGGVPRLMFPLDGMVQLWCTNRVANFCAFEGSAGNGNELVVDSFDALSGKTKELRRVPVERGRSAEVGFDYAWQLSPDGSEIAILRRHQDQIRLVPVDGRPARIFTVKGYSDIGDLSWDIDSRSLFVTTYEPGRSVLLRVDFNGNARRLWRGPQTNPVLPAMSPDRRHLAVNNESHQANVWMIDNF